jgi:methionyl-tRNA formyltransferase
MRIIFAGTPDFAATALHAILEAGFTVPLVLTQPDRPAGRGMQLQPSPVKKLALAHGISVIQPPSLKKEADAALATLRATPHDVMIVAAYGLLLPQAVLDIPPLGCTNVHASFLQRWRCTAPIHRAIEAGDAHTGVCIMRMEAGLDTGPVYLRQAVPIARADTTASLHDTLAALGGRMIVEFLRLARAGTLPAPVAQVGAHAVPAGTEMHKRQEAPFVAQVGAPVSVPSGTRVRTLADTQASAAAHAHVGAQVGAQAASGAGEADITYAAKIEKHEAAIDWSQPAEVIARRIRAFDPFPGCTAKWGEAAVKIWAAEAVPAENAIAEKAPMDNTHAENAHEKGFSDAMPSNRPFGEILQAEASGIFIQCGFSSVLCITQLQKPGGKRLPAREFLAGAGVKAGDRLG